MPRHTWRNRDSLSTLAAENGLATWERIWNDPANAALREERGSPENIRVGDIIEIPVPELNEVSRPVEQRHEFVRVGVPPATIKFIRDGGNPKTATPTEIRVVQVSTFVTTIQLPTGFLANSTDPRNFKIEVYDEGAGGGTITCELEAMKPMLDARGRPQRDADGFISYESFSPRRMISGLQLKKVPGINHTYRSRHLRLVTDNEDDAARPNQTLLVDHDPNDLRVEILDQQIVARYTATSGEPLATEAVVGDGEKRVRCTAFVCRTSFGSAGLVGGVTVDDVKRHFLCWVRRTYAAANMSPLLVDGEVIAVDPVENLVAINQTDRRGARGGRTISFRVNTAPAPTVVSITTVAGETSQQTTNRLATAARAALPAGYTVDVFTNPQSFNRIVTCDILIKNGANQVIIDRATTQDPRMNITVGRTRVNATNVAPFALSNVGLAENRVLIRNYRTNPRAVAVFVINRFSAAAGAVGFAYGKQFRERAEFQGVFPVAGSCFVEARTTSRADRRVHTTDHEMGHILIDMIHFSGRGWELMTDAPVQLVNNVWDSKRLSDRVIPYQEFVRGANRNYPINPNLEIRTREAANYIEGWDALFRRP